MLAVNVRTILVDCGPIAHMSSTTQLVGNEMYSENLLLGVKDRYFPNFQKVKPSNRSDLFKCSNASSIWYEGKCQYKPEDEGWYINLPKNLK